MMIWQAMVVAVLVFWGYGSETLNSIWMGRWCGLLILCTVPLALRVWRRLHPAALPIFASTLISAVTTTFWFQKYAGEPYEVQSNLRQASAMSGLLFAILTFTMLSLKRTQVKTFEGMFGFAGFLASTWIILWYMLGQDVASHVPFFNNPSMGASFIAVSLFVLESNDWKASKWGRIFYTGYALIAIFLTKSTTPVLAVVVGFLAWAMVARDYKRWVQIAACVPLVLLGIYLMPNYEWANDNGRVRTWLWAFEHFRSQDWVTQLFGLGVGTMRVHFPLIQVAHGEPIQNGTWWFWLHNDWLQILCEQGFVGFTAAVVLGLTILKRASRIPYLFAACSAFMVTMFFNFPLHWPAHAFLGLVLARMALQQKSEKELVIEQVREAMDKLFEKEKADIYERYKLKLPGQVTRSPRMGREFGESSGDRL